MLDPEGKPEPKAETGDTNAAPDVSAAPDASVPAEAGSWPAVGYWASRAPLPGPGGSTTPDGQVPPADWRPEPPPPAWTRTYDLPTARKVVSSGLQLAVASSKSIRRASIYIGLLALGAFGPSVVLLLFGIGRLMSDPRTAETLSSDPTLLFFEQPDIVGPLSLIYFLVIAGVLLLVAISIDAQAIAIAMLGGVASDRPLRLAEAVARARQSFWRLLGSGLLVGLMSGVITLVVALPFIRPFDTNEGITFIASMIGTLAITPFAFVATGIVLGDVGAMEALRRSVSLFRARPRIALVVVLFTLVTSAIQTFAVGAGLDVAIRVGEFLNFGLDEGGLGLVVPSVLVLAFIVAFGSLTFTIAAIVAAPQVAAFLGLTFYSSGLDRAREAAAKPQRFRWMTLPMLGSIVGLAVVAALAFPSINEFQLRPASPLLQFLRTRSDVHGAFVSPFGTPLVVEDPGGDQGAGAASSADILAADIGGLYVIPDWLFEDAFACSSTGVACGDDGGSGSVALDQGALLFVQRFAAAPPQVPGGGHAEWGQMIRVSGQVAAPAIAGDRFQGANHRFSTELDGTQLRVRQFAYEDGAWVEYFTTARSAWLGDVLVTIVPFENLPGEPQAWDAYATSSGAGSQGYDNVRPADGEVIEIELLTWVDIFEGFGAP